MLALHDTFSVRDGLVTNEYAHYNHGRGRRTSPVWIATSGSLFARKGQGWTGRPDGISPDICSCHSTGSSVFRIVTRRHDFRDVAVSLRLTNLGLSTSRRTSAQTYDGVHVFLRYQSQEELYAVSVNRRDGEVIVKKKLKGGSINGGRYIDIGKPGRLVWKPNVVQRVRVAIRDVTRGRVLITLQVNGKLLLHSVDDGQGGPPIRADGRVGLRGDNDNFVFDDFAVKPIAK